MYYHGWYLVAYERELEKEITPSYIGNVRLVLVRTTEGIKAYNADCPHRGAHLGYGGVLKEDNIVCPFHGYRIGLGKTSSHGFDIREYRTLAVGGLVFVQLSAQYENGFAEFITGLAETHHIIPGFVKPIKAPAELVIENGFDNRHFPIVHGVSNNPKFTVITGNNDELIVESIFEVPVPPRPGMPMDGSTVHVPYRAHTFSPGVITVRLAGDNPYGVITGSVPTASGDCVIRLSLALPKSHHPVPNPHYSKSLLDYSLMGIEQDQVMWENMSLAAPVKFTSQDAAVIKFQNFCEKFRTP